MSMHKVDKTRKYTLPNGQTIKIKTYGDYVGNGLHRLLCTTQVEVPYGEITAVKKASFSMLIDPSTLDFKFAMEMARDRLKQAAFAEWKDYAAKSEKMKNVKIEAWSKMYPALPAKTGEKDGKVQEHSSGSTPCAASGV